MYKQQATFEAGNVKIKETLRFNRHYVYSPNQKLLALLRIIHVVAILLRNVQVDLIPSDSFRLVRLTALNQSLQGIRRRHGSLTRSPIILSQGHERHIEFSHHLDAFLNRRGAANGRGLELRLFQGLCDASQLLFLFLILQGKEAVPQANNGP